MSDSITVAGVVATTPRHLVTSEGLPITSFRLASTRRRFDRSTQKWVDGDTNWFTVTAFRQLAVNAVGSIAKGQRVVAVGRLRIRDWESGERSGTTVEIDADAIGHDLTWGSAVFTRTAGTDTTGAGGASTGDDSEFAPSDDGVPEDAAALVSADDEVPVPF